jgi:hypothetical protein
MHYTIIKGYFSLMIDPNNPEDTQSIDSLMLDLSALRAATDNFDESNKLGEGGFGMVYKVQYHFT